MKQPLDKLTLEEADKLVKEDKARLLEQEEMIHKYLIYQNKLYIKRADGYFELSQGPPLPLYFERKVCTRPPAD